MCCFYGHCPASHGRHIVEISIYPCLVTLSKRPISFAWFTLWVAGGQLGGRRRVSMEDNLRWKMTFDGRHPQSCKKNFSIRYPNFLLKNVRTLYLLNYAIKWRIILKNVCFFTSIFFILSWTVSWIYSNEAFLCQNAKISSNYLKMSGFSSRNVRYPRYQDTDLLQPW